MRRYEASFEVESRTDAHAVRILVEQLHNTLREELRGTGNDDSLNRTLEQLEEIRDATRNLPTGTLTVVYEQHDGSDDD